MVFWGSPGCRTGLCCTGFAFQGELAPCFAAASPKCVCRAQIYHPLSGVSLGTKSSCREWMSGRCCWCSLLVLSDSSPSEDMGRGRKDHHHSCMWHKSTQGRCAGALPVPKTFSPCPKQCVHALDTGTSCPGRALERAVLQGRDQLLLAQPSQAFTACCVQPRGPGHLLCQTTASHWDSRREELGVSAKKIPKPESPVAKNTEPCIFSEVYE